MDYISFGAATISGLMVCVFIMYFYARIERAEEKLLEHRKDIDAMRARLDRVIPPVGVVDIVDKPIKREAHTSGSDSIIRDCLEALEITQQSFNITKVGRNIEQIEKAIQNARNALGEV